jgi:hypothetical protein
MLWMYRRVMFGPVENPENRGLIDLDWRERAVMLALLAPILWLGLYPDACLRRIEPSVVATLRQMEARRAPAETGDNDEQGADLQAARLRVSPLAWTRSLRSADESATRDLLLAKRDGNVAASPAVP